MSRVGKKPIIVPSGVATWATNAGAHTSRIAKHFS